MITQEWILQRSAGMVWGLLVGDALGSTYEFGNGSAVPDQLSMVGGGPFKLKPGQVTDDGEMAITLLRSMAANGGHYNRGRVMAAYVDWAASSPVDMGMTTANALVPPHNLNQDSEANGALMRVAPIALLTVTHDIGHALGMAVADCTITHPNQVCINANLHFVWMLFQTIFNDWGNDEVLTFRHLKRQQLVSPSGFPKDVVNSWLEKPPADFTQQQGWVMIALGNAIYQLANATSYEQGITDTIKRGGDTDTNAAIAGALLGAKFGINGIPFEWVNAVRTCNPDRPEKFQAKLVDGAFDDMIIDAE